MSEKTTKTKAAPKSTHNTPGYRKRVITRVVNAGKAGRPIPASRHGEYAEMSKLGFLTLKGEGDKKRAFATQKGLDFAGYEAE